jgi:hypothetical protein
MSESTQIKLADQIRHFVFEMVVRPALKSTTSELKIRAGDILAGLTSENIWASQLLDPGPPNPAAETDTLQAPISGLRASRRSEKVRDRVTQVPEIKRPSKVSARRLLEGLTCWRRGWD